MFDSVLYFSSGMSKAFNLDHVICFSKQIDVELFPWYSM